MKKLAAIFLSLALLCGAAATALADGDTEEIETYVVAEEIPLDCRIFNFDDYKYCLIKPVSGSWKDCVSMTDMLFSFDGGETWLEPRRGEEGIEVFVDGMWTNIKTVAKERGTSLQTETRTVLKLTAEVKIAPKHFSGKPVMNYGLKLRTFK